MTNGTPLAGRLRCRGSSPDHPISPVPGEYRPLRGALCLVPPAARRRSLPSCAGLCSEPAVSAPLSSQWHVSYCWLRAFQLQQRKRRLSVMELPRLLAPCSPTNRVPGQFYSPAIRDTRTRPNSSSLPRAVAHWAICAPAASLRTMGRLSCPFSGAEPSFPGRVTSPVAPYATGSMMRQKRDADA